MRRRSLIIDLRMREETAECRRFKNRLEAPQILAHRGKILSALWTILITWHRAGNPPPLTTNPAFPEWCDVIAGAVQFAGFGCPTARAAVAEDADEELRDMRALVDAALSGVDVEVTKDFNEVVALIQSNELFADADNGRPGDPISRAARSRLSKTLKRFGGRTVGIGRLEIIGKGHARRYEFTRLPAADNQLALSA